MTTATAKPETRELQSAPAQAVQVDADTMLSLVANGDASQLKPEQKLQFYRARCDAAGLDPRTQPFQFIKLQGREILYALKAATDQLAAKHGIVCEITEQKTEGNVRTVTVRARTKDGRQTDEIGCVSVQGLAGEALCNAYMKAVTKAKRRATISLCGLGMMDETEIETIRDTDPPPAKPKGKAPAPAANPTKDGVFKVSAVTYHDSDKKPGTKIAQIVCVDGERGAIIMRTDNMEYAKLGEMAIKEDFDAHVEWRVIAGVAIIQAFDVLDQSPAETGKTPTEAAQ